MQFFPSSESCFAKMKDSLYHAKHMFHFGTNRGFRMFDCLEQLELFAACFLQLRRTLVDLIPDRMSFIVDKNCIILLFCTQIPAVTINILLRSLKKLDNHVAVVHIGGCCFHRVNQSAVRIHADVLLVAEVPLVALFSLCGIALDICKSSLPVRGAWVEICPRPTWTKAPARRSPCGARKSIFQDRTQKVKFQQAIQHNL